MYNARRDAAAARALASHQYGPGSIRRGGGLSLLLVLWVDLVFLPPQNPAAPNSNLSRTAEPQENQLRLMWIRF